MIILKYSSYTNYNGYPSFFLLLFGSNNKLISYIDNFFLFSLFTTTQVIIKLIHASDGQYMYSTIINSIRLPIEKTQTFLVSYFY